MGAIYQIALQIANHSLLCCTISSTRTQPGANLLAGVPGHYAGPGLPTDAPPLAKQCTLTTVRRLTQTPRYDWSVHRLKPEGYARAGPRRALAASSASLRSEAASSRRRPQPTRDQRPPCGRRDQRDRVQRHQRPESEDERDTTTRKPTKSFPPLGSRQRRQAHRAHALLDVVQDPPRTTRECQISASSRSRPSLPV